MSQYDNSEEIYDNYTQLLELKHVYKELLMKEKNENERNKETLKILEAALTEKNDKLTKVNDGILKLSLIVCLYAFIVFIISNKSADYITK